MNIVTANEDDRFDVHAFASTLQQAMGKRLAGVIHTINGDTGDRVMPLEGESKLIMGRDFITERIMDLEFRIGMTSFFRPILRRRQDFTSV